MFTVNNAPYQTLFSHFAFVILAHITVIIINIIIIIIITTYSSRKKTAMLLTTICSYKCASIFTNRCNTADFDGEVRTVIVTNDITSQQRKYTLITLRQDCKYF